MIIAPLLIYVLFIGNVCLGRRRNDSSDDREGLVGALPEKDLKLKEAIACEGQKLYIECPNIYDRIQVRHSFYGRENSVTCRHPELPSDKNCTDQNDTVQNVVIDLCQGVEKCEVAATNDFLAQFGSIICKNVYKYLYVKYRCVPKNALADAPGLSPYDHSTSVTSTVTTNLAPVQCCYVVPGVSTSQVTSSMGGTIVRNGQGIQSVEERIVADPIQAQQTHKVTEIIQSHPTQFLQTPDIQPASIPDHIQNPPPQTVKIPIARITLPGISKLHVGTLLQSGGKLGTRQVTNKSPHIRSNIWGLQKKNVIISPNLLLRKGNRVAEKAGTNQVTAGSSRIRSNIKRLQHKRHSWTRKRNHEISKTEKIRTITVTSGVSEIKRDRKGVRQYKRKLTI